MTDPATRLRTTHDDRGRGFLVPRSGVSCRILPRPAPHPPRSPTESDPQSSPPRPTPKSGSTRATSPTVTQGSPRRRFFDDPRVRHRPPPESPWTPSGFRYPLPTPDLDSPPDGPLGTSPQTPLNPVSPTRRPPLLPFSSPSSLSPHPFLLPSPVLTRLHHSRQVDSRSRRAETHPRERLPLSVPGDTQSSGPTRTPPRGPRPSDSRRPHPTCSPDPSGESSDRGDLSPETGPGQVGKTLIPEAEGGGVSRDGVSDTTELGHRVRGYGRGASPERVLDHPIGMTRGWGTIDPTCGPVLSHKWTTPHNRRGRRGRGGCGGSRGSGTRSVRNSVLTE